MKKALCILLAAMLLLSLAACGDTPNGPTNDGNNPGAPANGGNDPGASSGGNEQPSGGEPSGDVIEIDVSLGFPEVSAGGYIRWTKEVEEATNNRVHFNLYYSYSLVATADVIKGLQTGLVDMAAATLYEYPSLFPLNGSVIGVPFVGWKDETRSTEIYWEMLEECPELMAEYEAYNLHYVSSYLMPGYNIFLRNKDEMTVPSDLKGHKIMTIAPAMQQLVAANGGAPVSASPPDFYPNMEKGVADSAVSHINVMGAFGVCPELVDKAVFFGDEYSGAFMYLQASVISDLCWNSLPSDIQAIFTELSPKLGQYMLESDLALTEQLLNELHESGAEIVVLNDEQVKLWADALSEYTASDLAEWNKLNPAAESIYNTLVAKLAE